MSRRGHLIALPMLALLAATGRSSAAEAEQVVELELVLAVDTSVSVDAREYALQMKGLAAAFRDPVVIGAIESTGGGAIAVALAQWGVGLQQKVTVGWTAVRDAASAEALARAIEASPRAFVGDGTDITQALGFAAELFDGNGYNGRRRVIDLSGDGRNNAGSQPDKMRDRVVGQGIVINGLAILDGDLALGRYFTEQVAGGTASFVITADTFDDFAQAIRAKLLREISAPVARLPKRRTPT